VLGGDWSAYWYNGRIYASEIARGLDVFELTPTQFLTQNEIDAAKTVRVAELNVQTSKNRVACAVRRGEGVPRSVDAVTGFAGRANRSSAEGDAERREFAHEQERAGEVEGHGRFLGAERATAMSPGDSHGYML